MRMHILIGGFTFSCPGCFCCCCCCVCVKGSDTAVLSLVSVWSLCREFLCYVALCIYIHMDTHRNIHNAFGTLHCGASPLVFLFYLAFCSIFCNSWWHEMLLYLLAEGAAVRSCCFVLWIRRGYISLSCTTFYFGGIIGCDSVWYFSVIVPCLFLMGGGLQRRHCLNCAPNSQSTLSRNRSQPSLQFQAKHKSERDEEQRREGRRKKTTYLQAFLTVCKRETFTLILATFHIL